MSQSSKYHMTMSQVQALSGQQGPKISASHWGPKSVTDSSGFPVGWRDAAKGNSDNEDEDTDEEGEVGSEEEENSEAEKSSEAEESTEAEESSEAEEGSDEEGGSEKEEGSDNAEDGLATAEPDESSENEADQRKVNFPPNIHKLDRVPTKDCNESFAMKTDDTERRKNWKYLDPDARGPPAERMEVVTSRSGRDSVAILEGGRRGYVKKVKKRS